VADGYTLVRTEGYVFPTSQPGTQPLVVLRHGERGDTLLAATSTSLGEARSAGYEVVRTEGYVFPCDMKVPLTLTTGRGGSLAGAGRTCAGSATACTLSVAVATPVTVTATSDDGFVLWSWGGGCAGQDNPCTLTPAGPGPVAISADFARVGTVSVEPGEGAPGGRWPRLCLEDTGHGFVLTRCRAAAAQTWVFSPGGLLVAPRSHLCLADLGGSTAANVPSNSAPYGCLANPAAEFSFEPMLKQFRNKGTGLCLRVGVAERSAAFWVLISGGCLSDQVWSFTAGHL